MKRSINSSISPNLESDDVLTSIKMVFSPHLLRSGDYVNKIESWFKYNFNCKYVFSFSSGRECLYAALKSVGVKAGDEVLVQAFTCSAVIYPLLWIGAKPIYIDINEKNLSMDYVFLRRKINKKTKAIILQHTFGIPGDIDKIKKIAKENKIAFIEDCAHAIGGKYKGKKLGTFSDVSIFSLGRDKAVSSVFGGIIITNKKNIAEKIKKIEDLSPYPSYSWIYQQLFHPIATFIILKTFDSNDFLGNSMLFLFKKLNLISKPVIAKDARTYIGRSKIKKYPNALAALGFNQILKVSRFNKKRLHIYNTYKNKLLEFNINLPKEKAYFLKIPIFDNNRKRMMSFFKKQSIYLGDWYSNVIDPKNTDMNKMHYKRGSCKNAEFAASRVVNLPCYPRMDDEDINKVVRFLKKYYGKKK